MKAKIIPAILVLIVSLGSAIGTEAQSPSATLESGSGSGMAGDTGISIPVTLSSEPGTQVSAMNFDLNFDSNRLSVSNVTIGSSAASAGKVLQFNTSNGNVRIIIYGGRTAISDGVIANVNFNVNISASPITDDPLTLSGVVATDPDAGVVTMSLSNGSFTVTAPPTSTPVPAPSDTPVPTSTRTPTATQVPSGGATHTPTLPATSTSSAPGLTSPTLTPTLISTSEYTPAFSPTVGMTAAPAMGMDTAFTSDEVVSKEMAQSIEMLIMATMTALADLDAQVAATGTALAMSTGELDGAAGDSESGGGLIFSDPLMWPTIIGISAGAVVLSIFGARVARKRRGSR